MRSLCPSSSPAPGQGRNGHPRLSHPKPSRRTLGIAPPTVMAGTAIHAFTIPKPSRRPNPNRPETVTYYGIRGSVDGLVTVTFQNINRGREVWSRLGFPDRVLPYAICPIMEGFRGKWQLILVAYKY